MCLLTDNPIPKVADKPIRVWKRLLVFKIEDNIMYITPYQYCMVKVCDSLKALDNNTEIQVDFLGRYSIGKQGVHAFVTLDAAKNSRYISEVITEWEIPVGAKYWIGNKHSKNEIAATEMKFIKVCEN